MLPHNFTSVNNLNTLELVADDTLSLLITIPGFGLITTAYIISMLVDINRFENTKAFSAYFGIVPKQRESGGSAPRCPITRRGDETGRKMLLQATFTHLQYDHDGLSPVSQMYDRLSYAGSLTRRR